MSPIAELFNQIASKYDFLNHLLSLNIDKRWRRKAIKGHISNKMQKVLDVACGTGDFSIEIVEAGAQNVVGIDIAEKMVELGTQKVQEHHLQDRIHLQTGDCASLPFDDHTFDAATIAFGVRNFEQRAHSLQEVYRVLKPGAPLIILEFSQPQRFPVKQLYHFYFKKIFPLIGGIISGNKSAYQYLPASVYAFPQGEAFLKELTEHKFTHLNQKRLSFGIASVYYAKKPIV